MSGPAIEAVKRGLILKQPALYVRSGCPSRTSTEASKSIQDGRSTDATAIADLHPA